MAEKALATCTECGHALGPLDETCPECGELTRLGLEREQATRREAGLAGIQHVTPRIIAIVLLFAAAAGIVYIYLYQPQLVAFWKDVVRQIQLPTAGPTATPAR